MIRCPYCNTELEDDARFCGECGNPIPETTERQVVQQSTESQQSKISQAESQQPEITQSESQWLEVSQAESRQPEKSQAETQQHEASKEEVLPEKVTQPEKVPEEEVKELEIQSAVTPQVQAPQPKIIYCPNCGKQLPEGARFCGGCGFNMETSSGAASTSSPAQDSPTPAQAPQKNDKKKFPLKVVGIIAACVVVLIVGIALFVSNSRNSGKKIDYAMYIKEREMFYSNLNKKTSTQVTENFLEDNDVSNYDISGSDISSVLTLSDDGKYLFYPDKIDTSDDGLTIYWKKVSNLSDQGTKIDSGIEGYKVSKNAAYMTYLKSDSLYTYDVKKGEKEKIAGDVECFAASENGKQVIYVNDEGTLYLWTMGGDKDKIDSEISRVVYISDDFKTMYYLKEDNLYKKEIKKDREKIDSDVIRVIKVYDSGSIYYLTEAEEDITIDMFINDDMAGTDANMQEPDYWSLSSEDYRKAQEEYSAKLQRDYLREEIADYSSYVNIATLCYYDGKNSSEVITGFVNSYSYTTATDSEAILFLVLDPEDVSKVKMSKITEEDLNWYSIVDIVEEAIDDSVMYAMVQKDELVSLDLEEVYNLRMNSDGTKILYIEDYDPEKEKGDLRMASIKNGRMSDSEKVGTDVYSGYFGFIDDSDSYFYYTDVKNRHGDLYIDGQSVSYDVYIYSGESHSGVYYYYTDLNEDNWEGTLYYYEKGKSVKVADDVYDYYLIGDKEVMYLNNYSTSKYRGELYLYSKKKSNMLDDDVICILRPNSYSAMMIYPGYYY